MKHNWNKIMLDGKWSLYLVRAHETNGLKCVCNADLAVAGFKKIDGTVPGNFELDMLNAGLIEEPFYADNILALQELEDMHLWYSKTFTVNCRDDVKYTLLFDGIDTFSEIYLNGKKIGESDNALVPFEFEATSLKNGENELTVHIIPDFEIARTHKNELFSTDNIRIGSLHIRKAPHTYGWDIMPRVVSGGIWRSVSLLEKPLDRMDDLYLINNRVDVDKASLILKYNLTLRSKRAKDYTVRVSGKCGESTFLCEAPVWHTTGEVVVNFKNAKLWWPKGMGKPNLYKVTVQLLRDGEVVDTAEFNHGIRKIKLDRTDVFDSNGNGKFCFYINDEPFFVTGTNWVPMDAFHSRDRERLPKALEMLKDIGCNAVRCWGGNVYEDDLFYDFCDSNGIAVWQDFAMACSSYPQDEYFCNAIRREGEKIVRRLREHPSIFLWAGDNECDEAVSNPPFMRNPDNNKLTRQILPEVLYALDPMRPYLPSSPYMSWEAVKTGQSRNTPEQHVWGPRDYFKSNYYVNNNAVFISEVGYHGCNSPASVKKFISPESLWPWNIEHNWDNREWLVHATCAYPELSNPESYRIKLMAEQVKTLIGTYTDNIEDFAFASQVSQAEAMKYFIERMRTNKGRSTGVIWWNLVDGWPQFSDAVVDYYYVKKIAYNYIKNSQESVCLMFREPKGGKAELVAVNEHLKAVELQYTVKAMSNGDMVASGKIELESNSNAVVVNCIRMDKSSLEVYLIEWKTADGITYKNHYTCSCHPFDIQKYKKFMEKTGILKTEGFSKE